MAASVLIVQRRLTHYRVPLFERLRGLLEDQNVILHLAYGQPTAKESSKRDSAELDWATRAPNRYISVGNNYICYQHIPQQLVRNSQLVVVTQENRLLANYVLSVRRQLSDLKLALWGHGANFQGHDRRSWRESFKRWFSRHVDWWFTYTALSSEIVVANGFPRNKITCLNNTIDTGAFLRFRRQLLPDRIEAQKRKLGVVGAPVGVFLGSMYAEKRIDFLQAAADVLHARIPSFKLIAIGDGPQREQFTAWAASRDWVRFLGPMTGEEKILCLAAGDVLLNPGLVGLVILDSFCAELPIITTDCGIHSPEIAYLENWSNGVMTENSIERFVDATVALLSRSEQLESLRAGCRSSAELYSIDNMAKNFSDGILQALCTSSSFRASRHCA